LPPEAAGAPECEAVIERGMKTFVQVGLALIEIRERQLHREAGTG
jgi:hypothetical protein